LLIGLFGFAALQAVIMNKAMSLIVVMTALPDRLLAVPFDTVNRLVRGGQPARRRPRRRLDWGHLGYQDALGHPPPGPRGAAGADRHFGDLNPVFLDPVPQTLLGLAAGVGIGIVAPSEKMPRS